MNGRSPDMMIGPVDRERRLRNLSRAVGIGLYEEVKRNKSSLGKSLRVILTEKSRWLKNVFTMMISMERCLMDIWLRYYIEVLTNWKAEVIDMAINNYHFICLISLMLIIAVFTRSDNIGNVAFGFILDNTNVTVLDYTGDETSSCSIRNFLISSEKPFLSLVTGKYTFSSLP